MKDRQWSPKESHMVVTLPLQLPSGTFLYSICTRPSSNKGILGTSKCESTPALRTLLSLVGQNQTGLLTVEYAMAFSVWAFQLCLLVSHKIPVSFSLSTH